MASQVTTIAQKVTVDEVVDVVITDKTDLSGTYARSILIYGEPDGLNGLPILTIILKSDESNKINIHAPELDF